MKLDNEARLLAMATILGCTPAQVKFQLSRNARQLREMEAQARSTGREVNGYSADDLGAMALSFEQRVA